MDIWFFLKKWLSVSIILLLVYVLLVELFFFLAPADWEYQFFKQDWLRIKERIEASKKTIKADTIFIGDSVGGQLFPFNGSNQLSCNGSIYVAGNYFLVKNALKANPHIRTVVYLVVPDVLGHTLARARTFNYFVKPFYTLENRQEIAASPRLQSILNRNPALPFYLFNAVKVLKLNDFNYEDGKTKQKDLLSVESLKCLEKLVALCSEEGVTFHLASPPVPLTKKDTYNDWSRMKKQVEGTTLAPLFSSYFRSIQYLDDQFLRDNIHWKKDFIEEHRAEIWARIQSQL